MRKISIFISYRRADTAPIARAVLQFLERVPVVRKIFLDVVDIEIGREFKKVIRGDLVQATHVFLLVGAQWAGPIGPSGRSRLFDEQDMVRMEAALALRSDVRLVPVLVDGATVPNVDYLPDDLKLLPSQHAFALRTAQFDADMDALLDQLMGARKGGRSRWQQAPLTVGGAVARSVAGALAAGVLLVIAGIANQQWNPDCFDLTCAVRVGFGIPSPEQAQGLLWMMSLALLALGAAIPLVFRWFWYRR